MDTVTVTGVGEAQVIPSSAIIALGVEVVRASASEALDACAAAATRVLDVLLGELALPRGDLQSGHLSLQPQWDHGMGRPTLLGYQAASGLRVRVGEVGDAGGVLSAVVAAGGDDVRIFGLSLIADDTAAAARLARERAVIDAAGKAGHYAALVGRGLGAAVQISDQSQGGQWRQTAPVPLSSMSMPVQAGTEQVVVTISVVYELTPAG